MGVVSSGAADPTTAMDDDNATTQMQQKRMAAEPVGRPISLGSPGSSVTSRRNGLDFSAPFAGGAEDDRGEIGAAVVDSETPQTTCLQICEEMVLIEDLPFIAGSRRYAGELTIRACGLSLCGPPYFERAWAGIALSKLLEGLSCSKTGSNWLFSRVSNVRNGST